MKYNWQLGLSLNGTLQAYITSKYMTFLPACVREQEDMGHD